MPRPKKIIPDLYWLDQKGQWAVNLNGKRHLLGPDRMLADVARLDLVNRARNREPGSDDELTQDDVLAVPASERTVGDAIFLYLSNLRKGLDQRHLLRISKACKLLLDRYGELRAREFSASHLRNIRRDLVETGSYSRRYVNHLTNAIKTAWRWCVSESVVTGEQAMSVLVFKALREGEGGRETPPRLPCSPEAVEKTLEHLQPVFRDVIRLIQLTGMRPSEVLRMRRRNISTNESEKVSPLPGWTVSARTVKGVLIWLYAPEKHKTKGKGKVRVVALGRACQAILAPRLDGLAPEDTLFSPARSEAARLAELRENRKTPVQPSQQNRRKERPAKAPGEMYAVSTLDHAVRKACAAAGVEPWTPYQLRHGRAVAIADEHGEDVAADVLGHAEGSGVTGTYTRTKIARLIELAAREE